MSSYKSSSGTDSLVKVAKLFAKAFSRPKQVRKRQSIKVFFTSFIVFDIF